MKNIAYNPYLPPEEFIPDQSLAYLETECIYLVHMMFAMVMIIVWMIMFAGQRQQMIYLTGIMKA